MEILSKCRRTDVTFDRSGRIDISAFAASRIGLRHGDAINGAVVKGKHYLYIACKGDEMRGMYRNVCRRTKGNHLRAYNSDLAALLIPENEPRAKYVSASIIYVREYGRMLQINKMA